MVTHAYLRVVVGAGAGSCHPVTADGVILGRAPGYGSADPGALLALDDPWISRRHARLHAADGAWKLTDLGGRNRAFVDGAPLAQGAAIDLGDGAVIRIGDTLLTFRPRAPAMDRDEAAGGLPGCSPPAREVRNRLQQLSRTSGHVLILGETGTGKERVARALTPPGRPFVPQNCAELTRDLARSELFGHVRGSFTGAVATRVGLVEEAEQGVLFLDEIGELSPDVQAELLRFLEDGHYRPVGATELRHSRARLVAATNVDLDDAVRAGRFRRDLLARLIASNPPLQIPPLRARREDILRWASMFFDEATERSSTERHVVWNPGTAECLLLYPWPGNLRELRSIVRGLATAGLDLSTGPEQLPADLRSHRRALRGTPEGTPVAGQPAPVLSRDHIEALLSASGGSVRATANQLGIDRRKLYRLCDRLGIDLDRHRGNSEREEDDG